MGLSLSFLESSEPIIRRLSSDDDRLTTPRRGVRSDASKVLRTSTDTEQLLQTTSQLTTRMTTNVYDGRAAKMATDSRWSISSGRYVAFVDDANFDKLEMYGGATFMFAGKGVGIQQWKDWIRSKPTTLANRPMANGVSVCIVQLATNAVLFAEKQDITHDGALFAGTGALPAVTCWDKNRDSMRCVDSAKAVDIFTGGEVKFVDAAGKHNLGVRSVLQVSLANIGMVTKAIQDRGTIVDRKTGLGGLPAAPFKLDDVAAAANEDELGQFKAKIANGDLTPEAPCNGMYDQWTPEQEAKLDQALRTVFDIK